MIRPKPPFAAPVVTGALAGGGTPIAGAASSS